LFKEGKYIEASKLAKEIDTLISLETEKIKKNQDNKKNSILKQLYKKHKQEREALMQKQQRPN